jgi:hypothetical protein
MSKVSQPVVLDPHGIVQSGTATYTADTDTGQLEVKGHVTVKLLFKSTDYPFQANYKVDPTLFLSKNVKVGKVLAFGDVTITVVTVDAAKKTATATVTLPTYKLDGKVNLDLSPEIFKIKDFSATAQYVFAKFILTGRGQ